MNDIVICEDSIVIIQNTDYAQIQFMLEGGSVWSDCNRLDDLELLSDDCEALGQKLLEFANRIRSKGE